MTVSAQPPDAAVPISGAVEALDRSPTEARDRGRFHSGLGRVFPALSHRDYRVLWQGNGGTFFAQWMQQAAEGWLIYELTGSPLYLGLASLCKSLPLVLLSPMGGVLADRVDRRKAMIWTQLGWLTTALIVAALIVTGQLVAWHLLAVAVIAGSLVAGHIPARQALTAALVPKRDVTGAFAVHATLIGVMRIAAPQVAGLLLATVGAAVCYLLQAAGDLGGGWNRIRMPRRCGRFLIVAETAKALTWKRERKGCAREAAGVSIGIGARTSYDQASRPSRSRARAFDTQAGSANRTAGIESKV